MLRRLRCGGNLVGSIMGLLSNESLMKGLHGAVGLAGTAGLAYGAKKLIDMAAEKKAKEMLGKGMLGAPGYQMVPGHLVNPGVVGKKRANPVMFEVKDGKIVRDEEKASSLWKGEKEGLEEAAAEIAMEIRSGRTTLGDLIKHLNAPDAGKLYEWGVEAGKRLLQVGIFGLGMTPTIAGIVRLYRERRGNRRN